MHPLLARLAKSAEPGSMEALALQMIERLTYVGDALRQPETDRLWQSIPTFVIEYGNAPSLPAGGVLPIAPEFSDLVLIDKVGVFLPAGVTATLQLGSRIFPLAGAQAWQCAELLSATDTRSLTIGATAATSPVAVVLYGRQLAPTGNLAP
jgi:hypothetical protein